MSENTTPAPQPRNNRPARPATPPTTPDTTTEQPSKPRANRYLALFNTDPAALIWSNMKAGTVYKNDDGSETKRIADVQIPYRVLTLADGTILHLGKTHARGTINLVKTTEPHPDPDRAAKGEKRLKTEFKFLGSRRMSSLTIEAADVDAQNEMAVAKDVIARRYAEYLKENKEAQQATRQTAQSHGVDVDPDLDLEF